MNGPRTWQADGYFFKRYASAQQAASALVRSNAARAAGVPTPEAAPTEDTTILRFTLIDGTRPALDDTQTILRPLSALIRTSLPGLTRYDPFARIDARLGLAPPALHRRIDALRAISFDETCCVHGDFHPGQVLQDRAGVSWLVDLDDMARAPVEADLGNFAAWRVTQGDRPALARIGFETENICNIWAKLVTPPDKSLARRFAQIALIRRALKLAGNGAPQALLELASTT